ncbi:mitochondrial ribosomal large subunit component [Lunasporangiospora selenospora]|uniref:Mitochondrial ribosomal large subunit component n=1 Tax=Lunasporangiospora selenospora TaxID=979761 RepID=A0A9P6FKZ2_9FUNG|nr:mitochondrial ribosomal large subunit component [Lunasporangiospora selenospora]
MASLFRALSRTPILLGAARPTLATPSQGLVSRPSQFVRNFSFGSPSTSATLSSFSSLRSHAALFSAPTPFNSSISPAMRSLGSPANKTQRRFNSLQPKRMKYRKKHKGRIPIPIGGSTKGTYVEFGEYGLRIKEGARLTARQIQAAHTTIRRKIKTVKGSQIWTRVFPDIPVTSKGGESRMGKGKGSVDYYATRVGMNRIIFEIGGGGIRREHAKEAIRLASAKIPVPVEFVVKAEQFKPAKIPRAIPGASDAVKKTLSTTTATTTTTTTTTTTSTTSAPVSPVEASTNSSAQL